MYSFPVPSKHNISVRGFRFAWAGAGPEVEGKVAIIEELGGDEPRTVVEIYLGIACRVGRLIRRIKIPAWDILGPDTRDCEARERRLSLPFLVKWFHTVI